MTESPIQTTPSRPYIIRALREWIEDNNLTPYLHVDANFSTVMVPTEHVKEGQIVLNLSSTATHQLLISNDAISFSARFGGVSQNLYVPMMAVMGVYAKENGQGMFFDPEEYAGFVEKEAVDTSTTQAKSIANNDTSADLAEEKQARLEKAKKSGFRVLE